MTKKGQKDYRNKRTEKQDKMVQKGEKIRDFTVPKLVQKILKRVSKIKIQSIKKKIQISMCQKYLILRLNIYTSKIFFKKKS